MSNNKNKKVALAIMILVVMVSFSVFVIVNCSKMILVANYDHQISLTRSTLKFDESLENGHKLVVKDNHKLEALSQKREKLAENNLLFGWANKSTLEFFGWMLAVTLIVIILSFWCGFLINPKKLGRCINKIKRAR